MPGIVGAVLNAVVLALGVVDKLLTGLAKLLTGPARAIVPGE